MKIDNRQQFLVILTVAALGLLLANSVIITPLGHFWTNRANRIKSLNDKIKEGNALIAQEKELSGRWADITNHVLPDNPSLAEQTMVGEIVSWSQNTGVDLPSVAPQVKNDSTNYMTINCRVEANGTMSQLSRFLYEIEQRKAYKLDSVELSAHDSTGQQLTLGLQVNGLALLPVKTSTKTTRR